MIIVGVNHQNNEKHSIDSSIMIRVCDAKARNANLKDSLQKNPKDSVIKNMIVLHVISLIIKKLEMGFNQRA